MSAASSRSDYGSFELIDAEQATLHATNGGYLAPNSTYGGGAASGVNLPPTVRYPPSYRSSRQQYQHANTGTYPTPAPRAGPRPQTASTAVSMSNMSQSPPISTAPNLSDQGAYSMSDVIQQLDLAAGENQRLKDRLKENNMILEQKVQEIEQCLVSRDKDKHQLEGRLRELQGRLREAEERALEADRQRRALEEQRKKEPDSLKSDEDTNKFFEARVAVMGFKCRVMQLQGELEAQRKELRDNSSGVLARDEVERLERENVKLKSELAEARDLARKHASGGGNLRREKELQRQVQMLHGEVESYEAVVKYVNEQLENKRTLFASESQRMANKDQQQQALIQQLTQQARHLENQLAQHQQSYEQQVTSLSAQLNLARQDQARAQEVARQLTVAQTEMHSMRGSLNQIEQEAHKLRKQNEIYESKLKDNEGKMLAMEGKLKEPQKSPPTPKPRSDIIAQLKTEKSQIEKTKEELEMQVATVTSDLERERRARQAAEEELLKEKEKTQSLLYKNSQLQRQLGADEEGGRSRGERGEGRKGSAVVEQLQMQKAHWETEQGRLEKRMSEVEAEKKQLTDEFQRQREEVQRLQLQLSSVQQESRRYVEQVEGLEKERKEAVDAKNKLSTEVAQMTEEIKTLKESAPVQTRTQDPSSKRVEQRLNDTVGKLKALEGQFQEAKRAKEKSEAELSDVREQKDKLQEEKVEFTTRNQRLEEDKKYLEREKQRLEADMHRLEGETVRSMQQRTDDIEQQLREKESEIVAQRLHFQQDIDKLRSDLSTQKEGYQRKFQEKETECETLKKEVSAAQREREEAQHSMLQVEQLREDCRVKNEQLTRAQQQVNQLGTQVHSLQAECARLKASHTQITTHVQEAQQEKDRLQRELSKTHQLAEGYKGECQSLVQDYQTAGGQIRTMEGQIRSLEEERDRYKRQADMGLRELALRADRIAKLEATRKDLEEQLQHMDLQLKQYMADFTSERAARENAMQVKDMAEKKNKELSHEVTALQQHLNQQAAGQQHMESEDQAVGPQVQSTLPSSPPVAGVGAIAAAGFGGGGGGGGRGGGGGGRPEMWSSGSNASSQSQRSGDHGRPPYPSPGEPSGIPPPLPPKPSGPPEVHRAKALDMQPYGGGGGGGGQFAMGPQRVFQAPGQELVTGPGLMQYAQGRHQISQPSNVFPQHRPGGQQMVGGHQMMVGGMPSAQPPTRVSPRNEPPPHRLPERAEPARDQQWVAPGEVVNENKPEIGCPICGRNDFATVTDLEIHCARCT